MPGGSAAARVGLRSAAMVLSDRAIRRLIEAGRIGIDPYDPGLMQPSSLDVRCDRLFRVFRNSRYPYIDVKTEQEELTETNKRLEQQAKSSGPEREPSTPRIAFTRSSLMVNGARSRRRTISRANRRARRFINPNRTGERVACRTLSAEKLPQGLAGQP